MLINLADKLDTVEKGFSILEHAVTCLALITAGIWTYYTYIKGRLLAVRLELKVTGQLISVHGGHYIIARGTLKNVGNVKVKIDQYGTALILETFDRDTSDTNLQETGQVTWRRVKASSVFVDHHWIEPGETIEEEALITVPPGSFNAYKLALRANTPKTTFTASSVVNTFNQQLVQPSQQSLLSRGTGL
jgi:hypothetical protein